MVWKQWDKTYVARIIKNNPYWLEIQDQLRAAGYQHFEVAQSYKGSRDFEVTITTVRGASKYYFPLSLKSFKDLEFKSKFKNFLVDMRERGLDPPPDHRVRKPGGHVLKQPSNIETRVGENVPSTLLAAREELAGSPSVEGTPAHLSKRRKTMSEEPTSVVPAAAPEYDTALTVAIMGDDLAMILELLKGRAKHVRSRPLEEIMPNRLTGKRVPMAPTPVRHAVPPRRRSKNSSMADSVLAIMSAAPTMTFTASELRRRMPNYQQGSISGYLAMATMDGIVQRVERGEYRIISSIGPGQ